MIFQITERSYKHKPEKGSDEWGKLTWKRVDGTLEEFYNYIRNNHFYRANLASTSNFGTKVFVSSQVVMLDYDKGDITMHDFVSRTKFKPTFYYRSHSSNELGNKFRLGYIFDKPITSSHEYEVISKTIADNNEVLTSSDFDSVSYSPYQLFCGAEYGLKKTGNRPIDLDYVKNWITERNPDAFVEKVKEKKEKKKKPAPKKGTHPDEAQRVKEEFYGSSYEDFINRNMKTPIISSFPIRENEAFYFYDKDNYFEVIRKLGKIEEGVISYFKKNTKGGYEPLRWVDGERRRRKIAVSVSFIHQIKPDITLNELLAQTLLYINNYIDNSNNSISDSWIWDTVFEEFTNPKGYNSKIHKSMRMKKEYFSKFHEDKHHKTQIKEYKKQYCISNYDFGKSLDDNLLEINRMLKEETSGTITITKRTLTSYLNEDNLLKDKPVKELKFFFKKGLLTMEILDSYRDKLNRKTYFKYKKLICS